MSFPFLTEWPQFFTATNYKWLPFLKDDKHKYIIIESLKFMVQDRRFKLYGFSIMINHIHLIWQPLPGNTLKSIQFSFMKFTAQQIKFALINENTPLLENCRVNKKDREFQIWKRKPLSIELSSESMFMQKLGYTHNNAVAAGICTYPEEYNFSSALFYQKGIDKFNMLTHYLG